MVAEEVKLFRNLVPQWFIFRAACSHSLIDIIIDHDDSNRSILLLEASKYFLRHLFASTFVVKTVSSTHYHYY